MEKRENSTPESSAAICHDSDNEPDAWIEVPAETMALLRQIAKLRNCTLNAALEEAIREFDPNA